MAVYQRREQAAVHVAGHRHVLRRRLEFGQTFAIEPEAAHVKTVRIQPPAAVAVREIIRVKILDRRGFLSYPSSHRRTL